MNSWLFLPFSLAFCGYMARELSRGLASRSWRQTEAQIIGLEERKYFDSYSRTWKRAPHLRYRYAVGNENFESTKISHDLAPLQKLESLPLSPGQPIKIFVDPAQPRKAVVFPGISSLNYLWICVSAFLLAVNIFGLWPKS